MSTKPKSEPFPVRTRRPFALFSVALLLLVAAGIVFVSQRTVPQTIATGTSPDGSWSLRVVAKPLLLGDWEVVLQVGNDRGEFAQGGMVIGLIDQLAGAHLNYAVTFDNNETARVDNRVIEKSRYFR